MSISKDNKEIYIIEPQTYQLGNFRYRLGIISDRHCGASYGASNLAKCLQNLKNHNCEFIIQSGDMTINGTESDWASYVATVNASPFLGTQIHCCMGNHENYAGIDTAKARFLANANGGALSQLSVPYYYEDINGDRFIYTWLETTSYTGANIFSETQMNFIENAVNTYNGTGFIWILSHQHFQWQGSGDWPESGYYDGGIRTSGYAINTRFLNLLNSHQDKIIHVHGHSHFSARYINNDCPYVVSQGKPGKLCALGRKGIIGNYTRHNGCISIHCPSGTRLRYSNNDSSTPNSEHLLDGVSESIAVDVYENGIRLMYLNDGTGETICTKTIIIANKEIKEIKDENNNVIFTWR